MNVVDLKTTLSDFFFFGSRVPDMVIYLYKVSAHDPYILYIYIYDHIRGPRPSKKKISDNVVF